MSNKMISGVIVGADRITANGDVANKIGTYTVAILAKEHSIPFYVAAPASTIDFEIESGKDIIIEERDGKEIGNLFGTNIINEKTSTLNYAFDVTPNHYIDAIITENGIAYQPYSTTLERISR